jgi:prevent-host-death family protein
MKETKETTVTLTALRHKLGKHVNRVGYGKERIILISRGEPVAALVSIEDLRRIQRAAREPAPGKSERNALRAADKLRVRIERWQRARGIKPEDSVITLEELRGGRVDELSRLR